jgi:hypothetical protein
MCQNGDKLSFPLEAPVEAGLEAANRGASLQCDSSRSSTWQANLIVVQRPIIFQSQIFQFQFEI